MDTAALIDDHANGLFTGASDTGRENAKLAIFCAGAAFVLAMAETVTSIFDRFPFPLSLPIFGMMAVAIGSREIAARSRLANQTRRNASSRRELEAKNRWFSVTEAHARVGHWRLDLTTNEVFWSDATFAIHGLKPSHPPSLNDAINFYHTDDRSYVVQTIERARETGQPYNFRARIITPGGETRHVEAAASVECASDGTPAALFGVVKDRTGEEAMQADLRQARDQANALASAKGQFLSRMSHEIRTPMNGLLGFAELLELSQLSAEQRRHTELIIGSAKSLQMLLNDILDLSKIEAGRPDIRYGETDVSAALQSVIATSAKLAQHKGIRLVTDIGPGVPPKINVDAARLRQILCNLVSNSVRFTDTGIVSLAASKDGDGLSFSVTDTGAGIEPHRRDSIFTFSNQDQSNPTDLKNGTGLGLAMSRQLARLMGGDLTVRSEFGQGSIFTLTLPDHADHVLATTASDSQDVAPKSGSVHPPKRVLLVEDFEINRELMKDMAAILGVDMDFATDGAEAIALADHARATGNPFGLILMDLQMPKMDGLEATRKLRAAGFGKNDTPIIALTANAFADDVENCLKAGMQAHLAKPISIDALKAALQEWAPQSVTKEPAEALSP